MSVKTMVNLRRDLRRVVGLFLAGAALAIVMMSSAVSARADFGIAAFDQQITADSAGSLFTQADGHPYAITTEVDFNAHREPEPPEYMKPDQDVRDVAVELPPGEVGNPAGLPQCTMAQLSTHHGECPVGAQVGFITVRTNFIVGTVSLYNLVPPTNSPALFGFNFFGTIVTITGNVRNGGDYGITVLSPDIPTSLPIDGFTLTFWGTPADPSHDSQRCVLQVFAPSTVEAPEIGCPGAPGSESGPNQDPVQPTAFLTIPGQCTAPGVGMKTTLQVDSWHDSGVWLQQSIFNHLAPGYPLQPAAWGEQQNLTGCDVIPFQPSISVQPTNTQADTPSGLNIDISLPQDGLLNPVGIATADVKKAVVVLPEGESVSPSAADGLGACSLEEVALNDNQPAACPDSSKLGTVEIVTPLLTDPLKGSVFLGRQGENPFGSLIALYIVVEGHGVILKLAGRVDLDPVSGRITTTFDNNPQLPFSHLKLNFKGGPRSPLVNPHECGTYSTDAVFTPWSGNASVSVASSFQITSGPNGSGCPGSPQAFAPGFSAGTTNVQAGAFSPFSLTFTRNDGEQQLGGVSLRMPLGLLGTLAGIPLCGDPQASSGSCDAGSQIGNVTAGAGAGANPFYVQGGRVYLTGGYKGAPFGLSIVVPAIAGPFDLGLVVVRAAIIVDPHTAQLTIVSDPLPTILQGIPLDLRVVNVNVDRPGFIFNATNCNKLAIAGTLTGGAGGSEAVSSSYQVTNCGGLGFKPKFSVSTSGRTSRANGASLDAKIVYPRGAQANIARVKVDLPKQLPSRLTTLQKACAAEVFAANPASCPTASLVGNATASTPVLPVKLSGPVYFVSNGGAAFPNLVLVLQGYGVTVQLVGDTFISKTGITSSTFKSVPDVPISTFELKLPQGRNSALAANGNLCKAKLVMPTTLVAQDASEIHQSTKIAVTGCPKAKQPKKKSKRHKPSKRSAKR